MERHPQTVLFLDALRAADAPAAVVEGIRPSGSAAQLREEVAALRSRLGLTEPPTPIWKSEELSVPAPAGAIPIRLYRPSPEADLAMLVFFHGGGWVIGGIESHDGTCRALAREAGCLVASVEYRLAPEHKFPAALDDAEAAARWLIAHAGELGGDPTRVAVGGDSAGGNLAAAVSILLRDQAGQAPIFQLLIYPVTDLDFDTPSYRRYARGYHLGRELMMWFAEMYLSDRAQALDPRVAPLRSRNLEGLPPALVIGAECDPLCSEGEAYATRLREAGVPATYTRYDGVVHSFFGLDGVFDAAPEAVREAGVALRQAFSR